MSLSLSLWGCKKDKALFRVFLFISYLTFLFFLTGLRFIINTITDWNRVYLAFEIIERIMLVSLIYFLSATMNFILRRRWTSFRITRVLVSSSIYIGAGIVSLFIPHNPYFGFIAMFAFLFIILFVLSDAFRKVPLIHDDITRMSLFLLCGITFIYLPLSQFLDWLLSGYEWLLFIAASLYYLILAVCANVYFHRSLVSSLGDTNNEKTFHDSCKKAGLTEREEEIAILLSMGFYYKEIATKLSISPNTVGNHISTIYRKTNTRSKVEMVNFLRKLINGSK